MRRAVTIGAALLLLLVGCSSDGEGDPPSDETEIEAVSLADTCPEVEAALPNGFLPPASKWETYAGELDELAAAGDTETQNALAGLQDAVDTLADDPPAGNQFLDADQALLSALDNLADRCKAVGSSALQ